jgi:uncharacterized membrane protein YiaA
LLETRGVACFAIGIMNHEELSQRGFVAAAQSCRHGVCNY